jgi:hypothetical protein
LLSLSQDNTSRDAPGSFLETSGISGARISRRISKAIDIHRHLVSDDSIEFAAAPPIGYKSCRRQCARDFYRGGYGSFDDEWRRFWTASSNNVNVDTERITHLKYSINSAKRDLA